MKLHRFTGFLVLVALSAVLLSPRQILAGDRAHVSGLFLRLSGGGGAASTEIDYAGTKTKIEGSTADINLAIGGIIAKNLALHGTVWGWITSDPDVTEGSVTIPLNGFADFSAFGGGITYYFMPANIYLSGSVGVGTLSLDGDIAGIDVTGETDLGPAFDITIGKEWWVGTSWGLGVALSGGFHSVKDGGVDTSGATIDEQWQGGNLAVRFTATLN